MNELPSEHLFSTLHGLAKHLFPLSPTDPAKLRGRPAHVNNRDCQNLEKILEVLYGGQRALVSHSGGQLPTRSQTRPGCSRARPIELAQGLESGRSRSR